MSPAALPSPTKPILPLPAPVELVEVTAHLEAGPNANTQIGSPRVVYDSVEFEKLMNNMGELYRWMAEATDQLNYYRSGAK